MALVPPGKVSRSLLEGIDGVEAWMELRLRQRDGLRRRLAASSATRVEPRGQTAPAGPFFPLHSFWNASRRLVELRGPRVIGRPSKITRTSCCTRQGLASRAPGIVSALDALAGVARTDWRPVSLTRSRYRTALSSRLAMVMVVGLGQLRQNVRTVDIVVCMCLSPWPPVRVRAHGCLDLRTGPPLGKRRVEV